MHSADLCGLNLPTGLGDMRAVWGGEKVAGTASMWTVGVRCSNKTNVKKSYGGKGSLRVRPISVQLLDWCVFKQCFAQLKWPEIPFMITAALSWPRSLPKNVSSCDAKHIR